MTTFVRFPHTPHLAWLGAGQPRDDKVLSPKEGAALLDGPVVVEEKVDGANLGFSLGSDAELRIQNRGQYLHDPYTGQFARLSAWLAAHRTTIGNALLDHSERRIMLFGEWCAARHSLNYDRLPDWFLLFDVLEAGTGQFWSSNRRDALAAQVGLATTPRLAHGRFTTAALIRKLNELPSRFRDGPLEGIVIRQESMQWCEHRAKLVQGDFVQAIGKHWRDQRIVWNRLNTAAVTP